MLGLEFPKRKVVYFANFYLVDGELPRDQLVTLRALERASESTTTVEVEVVVSTSQADYSSIATFLASKRYFRTRLLGHDSRERKLPFVRDILPSTAELESLPFDYCIYANADICVPQFFFEFIALQMFQAEHAQDWAADSVIINRRNIVAETSSGPPKTRLERHPGYDMFIFPSRLIDKFVFGDVFVGVPPIGALFTLNLLVHSRSVLLSKDLLITHHFGNEQINKRALGKENVQAAVRAFRQLTDNSMSLALSLPFLGFEKKLAMRAYEID